MTPQPVKVRADVEVTCFAYEGIDAIKTALTECEAKSTEDVPIKVRLVAPPLYVITTTTLEKQLGIEQLESAISNMSEYLVAQGGSVVVKMKPRAVSATDEKELAELMERVERENAEVSGDDDVEDEMVDD
jgi:translation initiation factor 2 subunit 1